MICGILGISNSQSPDGVMFHLLFSNTLTGGGNGLFLWSHACARSHSISVGFLRVLFFPLEDKTCCSDMLCFGIFFNFFVIFKSLSELQLSGFAVNVM